jgi:heme oxygenase
VKFFFTNANLISDLNSYPLLIDELRNSTKQAHLDLDHKVYPIIQQVRSTEDYAKLLDIFYSYFKPLYGQIDQLLPATAIPDHENRRKPEWILTDKKAMGIATAEPALCTNLPQLITASAAIGSYYVLEGSTMGGSIISKKIAENLGLKDDSALRFFNGYGEQNRNMWNDFLKMLNAEEAMNLNREELIDAAQKTFVKFKDWINENYG